MRECCRQGRAEVISNSSNKTHQTWGPSFSRALYIYHICNILHDGNIAHLASSMALVSFLRSAFSFLTKASRSRISRSFASFSRCKGGRSMYRKGENLCYACPGLVFINFGFQHWIAKRDLLPSPSRNNEIQNLKFMVYGLLASTIDGNILQLEGIARGG